MADLNKICKTCHRKVQSFNKHVQCKNCKYKHHSTCVRLDKDSCNVSSTWYCPHCIQTILPFNHIDEDEDFFSAVMEQRLNCSFRFHEMNSRVFVPFEINQDSNTPFTEIDPDFTLKVTIYIIWNVTTIWKTHSMIISLKLKQRISVPLF